MSIIDRMREARLNALYGQMEKKETDPNVINRATREAESKVAHEVGDESESRFKYFVEKNRAISATKTKAGSQDDRRGVDFWLDFHDDDLLPAQVKSSDDAVAEFKRHPDFMRVFRGRIVVVNCSRSVNEKKFMSEFDKEIDRINNLPIYR